MERTSVRPHNHFTTQHLTNQLLQPAVVAPHFGLTAALRGRVASWRPEPSSRHSPPAWRTSSSHSREPAGPGLGTHGTARQQQEPNRAGLLIFSEPSTDTRTQISVNHRLPLSPRGVSLIGGINRASLPPLKL